jgi:hypothetical protein
LLRYGSLFLETTAGSNSNMRCMHPLGITVLFTSCNQNVLPLQLSRPVSKNLEPAIVKYVMTRKCLPSYLRLSTFTDLTAMPKLKGSQSPSFLTSISPCIRVKSTCKELQVLLHGDLRHSIMKVAREWISLFVRILYCGRTAPRFLIQ